MRTDLGGRRRSGQKITTIVNMKIVVRTLTGIWNADPAGEPAMSVFTKSRSIRTGENFSNMAGLSQDAINRKAAPERSRYKLSKALYERGLPTFQRKNMQKSTDQKYHSKHS